MQHLLSVWKDVARFVKAAKRVMVLFDYDGTLTPIVERPELAELSERARQLLRDLNRQHRFRVGIISGRAMVDLRQRVGIQGIIYAGNHGLEIEGPGFTLVNPIAQGMRPVIRLVGQVLRKALGPVGGARVEDKGFTLSVHYREVEEKRHEEVRAIFEEVVATAQTIGMIRATTGKKVYEVRPEVDWDKGKAIALLLDRYGGPGRNEGVLPVFLGDDLTDEDGFKVIAKRKGISVYVGDEPEDTAASYYLRSPGEVEEFLNLMVKDASRSAR